MNRKGYQLENEIGRLIKYLAGIGIHGHKNHARRTADGKWQEGEPFDYEIFSGGKVFCFDAKECSEQRWNLKTNAKLSQVKNLYDCKRNGAEAFFLVFFLSSKELIKFDVDIVRGAMADKVKSLGPESGVKFDWRTIISQG